MMILHQQTNKHPQIRTDVLQKWMKNTSDFMHHLWIYNRTAKVIFQHNLLKTDKVLKVTSLCAL